MHQALIDSSESDIFQGIHGYYSPVLEMLAHLKIAALEY